MDELEPNSAPSEVSAPESNPGTFDKVFPQVRQDAVDSAILEEKAKTFKRGSERSYSGFVSDAFVNTPTVSAVTGLWPNPYDPDPNFTSEKLSARLREETFKKLPEEYWDYFAGVSSDVQFDALMTRFTRIKEAKENLGVLGWSGFGMNFLAEVLDPISLSIGIASGGLLPRSISAAAGLKTTASQRAVNIAAGGGAGLAIEGIRSIGTPVSNEEYALAAGLGMLFGGAFGPIAANPATKDIADEMRDIGSRAVKEAEARIEEAARQAEIELNVPDPVKDLAEPPKEILEEVQKAVDPVVNKRVTARSEMAAKYEEAFGKPPPRRLSAKDIEARLPKKPDEPTAPVEPTTPVDPVNPVEPTAPVDPIEPPKKKPSKPKPVKYTPEQILEYDAMPSWFDDVYVEKKLTGIINRGKGDTTEVAILVEQAKRENKTIKEALWDLERRQAADAITARATAEHLAKEAKASQETAPAKYLDPHANSLVNILRTEGEQGFKDALKDLSLEELTIIAKNQRVSIDPKDPMGSLLESTIWRANNRMSAASGSFTRDDIPKKPQGRTPLRSWYSDKKPETMLETLNREAKEEKIKAAQGFDPFEFSIRVVFRREGEKGLREKLSKLTPEQALLVAKSQHISVNPDDAGNVIDQVVAGAIRREAHMQGAAAFDGGATYDRVIPPAVPSGSIPEPAVTTPSTKGEKASQNNASEIAALAGKPGVPLTEDELSRIGDVLRGMTPEEFEALEKNIEKVLGEADANPELKNLLSSVLGHFEDVKKVMADNRPPELLRDNPELALSEMPPQTPDSTVGARFVRMGEPFLDDPKWTAVTDDSVPRSASLSGSNWERYDMAGVLGMSANPLVRLFSPHLINESVGLAGHAINGKPAAMKAEQHFMKRMTEYNQVRRTAYDEWVQENQVSLRDRIFNSQRFYHEVSAYIRGIEDNPSEPVKRLGDHQKKLQREILDDLRDPGRVIGRPGEFPPVLGADDAEALDKYLMRQWKWDHFRNSIREFGLGTVEELFKHAIESAQPNINPSFLNRLAKGMVQNMHKNAVGLGDEFSMALGWKNTERFRELLTDGTNGVGLSADEADEYIRFLEGTMGNGKRKANMANLKNRVFLDEGAFIEFEHPRTSNITRLYLTDLMENDANALFTKYSRRASGRVALANTEVLHRTGEVLLKGIRSDSDYRNILNLTKKWAADNDLGDGEIIKGTQKAVEDMEWIYNRIIGRVDPQDLTDWARNLGRIRKIQTMRLLNQVGFAQLAEFGPAIGALGFASAFQHVPAIRRIVDDAGKSVLSNKLFAELETAAIGVERLHQIYFHSLEELTDVPFPTAPTRFGDRLDSGLDIGVRATYETSLMSFIQQTQERFTAAAVAEKFASMARRLNSGRPLRTGDTRRLSQLGLTPEETAQILDQFQHASTKDGVLFGKKLTALNLDKWDVQARANFEFALFRLVSKIIQRNDIGNSNRWMHGPLARSFLQFRGYGFTAFQNQLLYNIHMRDPTAVATFGVSMALAGLVRVGQIYILAQGRSDKQEYLEKNLSSYEIGKAAVSRAGFASILPMFADTGAVALGYQGQFNARSTQQPSDLIFGSPIISNFDSLIKGFGGVSKAIREGREMSQSEVRTLFSNLPGQNSIPFSFILSTMIKDLPAKSPYKQQ